MKPHHIPRINQSFALIFSLLMITACSSDLPSNQNVVAQGGKNAVAVKTKAIPAGDATCPNGGILVESGIDENGNGLLEVNEVDTSEKVCNGTNGTNGSSGPQGQNGATGLNSLISLSQEPAGTKCKNGGVKIQSGLDSNINGHLDSIEVTSTEYLCNSSNIATNGDGNTNPATSNFSQTSFDALNETAVSAGGMLYDKWWKVASSATQPTTGSNHPLWPASNTNVADSDTWRCQECHGWDYRGKDGVFSSGLHYTGFSGIVATATTTMTQTSPEYVYTFLKTNSNHGFSNGFFTDEEYYKLTKFIITMRSEASNNLASFNFISIDKHAIGASITNGKILFEGSAKCSICHGADGKKLDFADGDPTTEPNEFLHNVAQDNPWEFVHRIRFGTPDSPPLMNGLYDQLTSSINTLPAAIDILGYAQNSLIPNVNRAGLLYDNLWSTTGVLNPTVPTNRNPIWALNPNATQDQTLVSNEATWRCVQCHGWDYQGVNGAFADTTNANYSGIAGFTNSQSKSKELLIDAITNGTCSGCDVTGHSFSQYLSAVDIDLLATFILNLASPTDYNNALNSTDTASGQVIYKSNVPGHCENCHGIDGKIIPVVDLPVTALNNPQEFLHKARYGYPGSAMIPPNQGFLGLTLAEAGNVLAYSKTLNSITNSNASYDAASMVRGGRLYDKWWSEMKANDANVQKPTGINLFYQNAQSSGNLPALATGQEDNSWRCKTCHAWNYKGAGYYTGTPSGSTAADNLIYKTTLRMQAFNNDVTQVRQHFFNWIKNGDGSNHQFGLVTAENPTPMKDQDIWDLVKFLLAGGLSNTDAYILASGLVIGSNLTNGQGLYNGSVSSDVNCSACHGVDGVTPPPTQVGGSSAPLDIFAIAAMTNNPWEFVHKVRFGQPGTAMPGTTGIPSLTERDAYDVLGYAQKRFNDRQAAQ